MKQETINPSKTTIEESETVTYLLKKHNGYIKGWGGALVRLMDHKHNPVKNFKKSVLILLIFENKVIKDGLVYRLK